MMGTVHRYNLVIIGDTHFGVRNNSMTWLKHQEEGFYEIIEYVKKSMKEYDYTHVIHVGDLFDSRSSINPLVWRSVVNLLSYMDMVLNGSESSGYHYGSMTIIGGNHDYYYPWESEHNFTGIQMLTKFKNINFVVNEWARSENIIMIPWFVFHNKKRLETALSRIPEDDIIITHTDPYHMDPEIRSLIRNHPLITGHIHQPYYDKEKSLLVTGSTYPIDFADTNSQRGFWNIEQERTYSEKTSNIRNLSVNFHPVESSIHFHSLTENMLEGWENHGIKEDDYVEVVIKQSHVDNYKETIKDLNDKFTTSMKYIPENVDVMMESKEVLNVDTVCQRLLPNKLKGCYQQMITAHKRKE